MPKTETSQGCSNFIDYRFRDSGNKPHKTVEAKKFVLYRDGHLKDGRSQWCNRLLEIVAGFAFFVEGTRKEEM
jgi:hypothetical protein